MLSHELNGLQVALLDLAEIDEPDTPVLIDYHVDGHDPPYLSDDLDLLLVKRIAVDDAVG